MQALAYYLFYGINWIVTLLPLRILYLSSDFLFLLMYYFPGYRRKIVAVNLRNSFPEKSQQELDIIGKKFYHHLCDLFVEVLKMTHMSERELKKRIHYTNPEVVNRFYNEGRDIVAVMGHYCNWEWMSGVPLFVKHQMVSIYKPLKNKYFDAFMNNNRTKNGMVFVPMKQTAREIIENRKNNKRSIYGFVTDQTPSGGDIKFWTKFLNQDTPVFLGSEKIAVKYDMPVLFVNVHKVKRGFYTFSGELLFEHSAGLPDHLITEAFVKRMEEVICEKPEYWLWSHRRWKLKREDAND